MKIAQVAPIWTSIPPSGYGGVEVIISSLTEELVKREHDVTLFASGDSKTKAKLFSVIEKSPGLTLEAINNMGNNMDYLYNMSIAIELQDNFDIIHWHFGKDIAPIMFASHTKTPSVITVHNHYEDRAMNKMKKIIDHYKDLKYFVSISNAHRSHFPFEYIDTVYNGIDINQYTFNPQPQKYLAWIGRFTYIKGAHLAIEVAKKLNLPLKLAAPASDGDYYKKEIEPHLGKDGIDYIGEIDLKVKNELLGNALALINPIGWDEPFGLVVLEANACGTPVVTFARGSMPEIIKSDINGYAVEPDNVGEMIQSVRNIIEMNPDDYGRLRQKSRQFAEDNFSIDKMTSGYEKIYQKIIEERK